MADSQMSMAVIRFSQELYTQLGCFEVVVDGKVVAHLPATSLELDYKPGGIARGKIGVLFEKVKTQTILPKPPNITELERRRLSDAISAIPDPVGEQAAEDSK